MKNQRGFALVEAVLIVIIIALLGGVIWYVVKQNKDTAEPATSTVGQPVEKDENKINLDKTITDTNKIYKISYPHTWEAKLLQDSSSGLGGPESETLIENSGIAITPENPSKFAEGAVDSEKPYLNLNLLNISAYRSSDVQALSKDAINEPGNLQKIEQINGYDTYKFTTDVDEPENGLKYLTENFLLTNGKITVMFSFTVSQGGDSKEFNDSDKLPAVEAIVNSLEIL
jgi:hypothetical protein